MKVIKKTYKFQLLPDKDQKTLLDKHFGCIRVVYNYFLNQRKEEYLIGNKSINYYSQAKDLSNLKKDEKYVWLKEVNSQSLQHSLKHLEVAYVNFFQKRTKFPRFKNKKDYNSFHVPQHFEVINNKLFLPKFKNGISINMNGEKLANLRNCTISKTPTDEYFVSILCEIEYQPIDKTGKSVGLDLGIKDFCITSDGINYENHKHTDKYAKKLKRQQQHLSRKKIGSKNKNRQRLKVAKIHKKITNSRNDRLHKISREIVNNYDIICIEDLNVKGMVKNKNLSKSISDVAWSRFVTYLTYKTEWDDKKIVKISRWFPSSKTCCDCGFIYQDQTLNIRKWSCPICGSKHDRDLNAAKNILKQGLLTYRQEMSITLAETEVTKSETQEAA